MASSSGKPRCSLAVLVLCVTSVSAQLTRQKPAVPLGTQVGTVQKTSQSTGSSGTGNGAVSIGLAPRTAGNTPAPAVPLAPHPGGATHPDAVLPDLIVSDIFLDHGEIKFKVKNIGQGLKPSSVPVNFTFFVWSPSRNWYLPGSDFEGIAARTSASQIAPGQEVVEFTGVRTERCSPGRQSGKPGLGNDDPGSVFRCLEISEPGAKLEVTINPGRTYINPNETPSLRESNLDNNQLEKYWAQMMGQAADLQVLSGYVEFGDARTGTAHVRVRNNGNVQARSVRMELAVKEDPLHPEIYTPLLFDNTYLRIDPGDWSDWQVSFRLPFDAENTTYCCKYTVTLDPKNSVIESRKDNNQLVLTDIRYPRADLLIDFADVSYFEEVEVQAAIFVRNAGRKAAPQFTVQMIVDNGARTLTTEGAIPGLNPGERNSVTLRMDHLPHDFWATSRCCVAIAVVDPANQVQESDKSNNRKVIHDGRPPKPASR